ncbi:MAG: phosphatidate cytidylyltransferase [Gammaproteobacteria bacterium]|nr:phosphatidate cytidylyltransferase [Gammaproteobacteria bacterium]
MTALREFQLLMGGIVVLLALASAIGWWLERRADNPASRDVVANLRARVKSWWVMVAVFAVAFLLGKGATLTLFAFASFFALREFVTLTPTRRGDHKPLFLAFFVLIPLQYLLIGFDRYGIFAIFIPVYAFLLLPAFAAVDDDPEDFLARSAKIQWGVMITVYCISHAPALMMLDIAGYEGKNALLVFYLVLVVQMSDVMQYVFGKLFGKRKVAPRISPSKTVAGLVGGGTAAALIGAAMWWITPFTPLQALGLSAIIVVMGFLGGLTLSAVKRSLGAKDWGVMIEGHGGMLDRMDSVSFAAPVFFHLVRWFYGG